jgi:uncharacterized BrkB/YihY/UPF0761 family membrane protein
VLDDRRLQIVNRVRSLLVGLDQWQREHVVPGVGFAVLKKFSDDRANQDVIAMGWYGFIAIYPAILAAVTILGLIGAQSLGDTLVKTLHSFPVIGSEFNPEHASSSLHGSPVALVVGLLGLVYGAQGATLTAQNAMAQVWNVPALELPKLPVRLVRSLLGLITIGGCFVANAPLAALATGSGTAAWAEVLVIMAMIVVNTIFYGVAFIVLTPLKTKPRQLVAGALVGSVGFTLLITVAVGLIQHQLRHSTETYGQFGVVIGLVGFLFLLAKLSLYGAELNSVLARHLWPRSLVAEDPTPADDQVLREIAQQGRRRKDQRIRVTFRDEGSTRQRAAGSEAGRGSRSGTTTSADAVPTGPHGDPSEAEPQQ